MTLIERIKQDHPPLTFTPGETFRWSPSKQTVFYIPKELTHTRGQWTLLHELGHGVLGHTTYSSDLQLVKIEAEAWHKAKQLAETYAISIDEDHIQDCLDTYRDWLHQRSLCPTCSTTGIQTDPQTYNCINCRQEWHVSNARFCRSYRKKLPQKSIAS